MVSNKTKQKKPNTKNKNKNTIRKCETSKTPQKPKQRDDDKTLQEIAKQKQSNTNTKNQTESKGKAVRRESGADETKEQELCKFAFSRVKRIAKSQNPDIKITNDAAFLINKATEKFLEVLAEDAHACSMEDSKKSLSYKHLANAVHRKKRYEFLSDFVPEMVKAEDALDELKKRMDAL